MKPFYIFLLFLLPMFSCNTGKSLLKEAKIYEEGGLSEKAFDTYKSAYQAYNKPEGLVGMKRVAQKNLNQKVSDAQMECAAGNHLSAISSFKAAFDYKKQFESLELSLPPQTNFLYESCVNDYVELLTTNAENAIKNENYEAAQQYIRELRAFDRNNKKAEYLDILSQAYPNYKAGVKAMELGLYRDAYVFFNAVTSLDADFKDALSLRNECLEKAKFNIAYIPVHAKNASKEIETSISAAVKQQIINLENPFIQLVERESLEQLIEEQMNSMSAVFDQSEVIEAGKIAGARYIITGEIISYDVLTAPQRNVERKGYLGPTVNDKKVKYVEHRLGRGLDVAYKYQILDAETGKIYASEVVTFSERDNVVWSEYEGDYTKVYPGEWKWQLMGSKEDFINRDEKDRLMEEFTGRKGPKTELELRLAMMDVVGREVAKAVKNFKP